MDWTMPVIIVQVKFEEVIMGVASDDFSPEGNRSMIFCDLPYLPGSRELVEDIAGDMLAYTLLTVLPHDEEFCYHPGILDPGQVIIACHEDKARKVAIHAHQERGALRLNPIMVQVWVIV